MLNLNSDVLLAIIQFCEYESIFELCLTCKTISNVLSSEPGKTIVQNLQNTFRTGRRDQILEILEELGDDLRNYIETSLDSKDISHDDKVLLQEASDEFYFSLVSWVEETLKKIEDPSKLCKYFKRLVSRLQNSTYLEVVDFIMCDVFAHEDNLDSYIAELRQVSSQFDDAFMPGMIDIEKKILLERPKLMIFLLTKLEEDKNIISEDDHDI